VVLRRWVIWFTGGFVTVGRGADGRILAQIRDDPGRCRRRVAGAAPRRFRVAAMSGLRPFGG
jgi:hypothetical protein